MDYGAAATAALSHYDDNTNTNSNSSTLPSGAVLRRFALFVDGMARAIILPFGPTLVYRLVNNVRVSNDGIITPTRWSAISFRLALVIAAFMVGRSVGDFVTEQKLSELLQFNTKQQTTWVARLGGLAIALHLFSCGAGLSSIWGLVALRFSSAVVVGILCGITDPSSLPEDGSTKMEDSSLLESLKSPSKVRNPTANIASGTARLYLSGFALSILTGGIFYRPTSNNNAVQALTGSYSFTWSPLFLIASTFVGEFLLGKAFALTTQPEHLDPTSGNVRKLRKLVRRVVSGKQRVSFKQQEVDLESLRLLGSPEGAPIRPRSSTAGSVNTDMDEFYDCQSEFSDVESPSKSIDNEDSGNNDGDRMNEVAMYKNGKCVYADGSPAYVSHGDTSAKVPANYLKDCAGDHTKAMKKWRETQKWRRERGVSNIHTRPHKFSAEIKKAYPHFAHGHSKGGLPVMYEQPGKMDLKTLFRGECTIDDMVHHYIFFQEFLNHCLCATPELRRICGNESDPYDSSCYGLFLVMDVKGAGINMLSTDILRYLKRAGDIAAAHYPLSMRRCCVANTPFWASGPFATIKSVLPDSVPVELLSESETLTRLTDYIDLDQIPPEYGGTSPYKLGEHPYEVKYREVAERANRGDFEDMRIEPLIASPTPADMVDIDLFTPGKPAATTTTNRPSSEKYVRRRTFTTAQSSHTNGSTKRSNMDSVDQGGVAVDSLAFVSFFCAFWSSAQGGIEIAIPLWLSSPTSLGGLGYTPATNGVAMFCVAMALSGMLTTKASRFLSSIPRNDPLRAIRIGLAAQTTGLVLLAFLPIYLSAEENRVSVFFLAVSLLSLGIFSSILGRSASAILRALVSECAEQQSVPANLLSAQHVDLLCVLGEVAGVFVNSEIWSLSVNREHPSKHDGSLGLFLPAVVSVVLYFGSYLLRINSSFTKTLGQSSPIQKAV